MLIERTVKDNSYQQGLFTEHIAEEMGLGLAEKEGSDGLMLKSNVQKAGKPVFGFRTTSLPGSRQGAPPLNSLFFIFKIEMLILFVR